MSAEESKDLIREAFAVGGVIALYVFGIIVLLGEGILKEAPWFWYRPISYVRGLTPRQVQERYFAGMPLAVCKWAWLCLWLAVICYVPLFPTLALVYYTARVVLWPLKGLLWLLSNED